MRVVGWLFAAWLLGGCATGGLTLTALPPELPVRVELADTPFFPDDSTLCGPSALATSLSAAGIPVTPEALVSQVYLPGREGALQIEMLAAARRQGAVATLIPGTMASLLRELAAGHAVLVLQNLGLSWAPSWHYAVVVGYDLDAGRVLLRSGPMKRQEMSLRTFEHTWDRSERWAFVTLPPGSLPATVSEDEALRALVAFERNAPPSSAVSAYRSGLARWPDNPTLAMGLGNALYAAGDKIGSEAVFGRVAARHGLDAAFNNQALVLLELGRPQEAVRAAEQGLALGGGQRVALQETLRAARAAADTLGTVRKNP